ncbi:unnamed protein product [Urochloa decumbens]|uniref:DUF4220 domain-containing protein n=1 Tax=Urochloa decumbens TaxID=240449 RepID=A0ABC8VYH0_9POAL
MILSMVWLGMILAMIWAQSVQWLSKWGFRVTVLSSLVAHLFVGFLSGTRRRSAPGLLWGFLGQLAKFFLWLAYQVAEAATASAIGSLSLCGSDASEEEKQVVAFWATFLLLHLGGPDNLTAYALEDNKMSDRKWFDIITKILGLIYTISKSTHRGGRSWAVLLAASVVMLLAGAVSYIEKAKALGKANLDSMQEDAAWSSTSSSEDDDVENFCFLKCRIQWTKRQGPWLRDGQALLLAQDLFPVWLHALVDSSVDPDSERQKASEMMLSDDWHWASMCKVAEMELSLIYDFLYTKAILAHTWQYYLVRLVSPLCTAVAALLFYFWLQQQLQVRGSFIWITYALLSITFLMDVAWLLRALGSTWAYAYLREQAPAWLRHQAEHGARGRRWWCSLHRIIVCLDPLQLFGRDPVSHRRWSGTIGQYNLLHECTATIRTLTCCSHCPEWWPLSKPGDDRPKEMRYLCKLPRCVKEVLFKRVTKILQGAITKEEERAKLEEEEKKNMYTREDIRTRWGQKAFRSAPNQVKIKLQESDKDKDPEETIFGKEFEEDVLLWHIATCMVLPYIGQHSEHRLAIEVMSEYMMFLVAVRRQMLPGLVLHSQLKVTRGKLVEIWNGGERVEKLLPSIAKMKKMANKEKLAMLLRRVRRDKPQKAEEQWTDDIPGSEGTRVLAQAVDLYFKLSGDKRRGVESRDIQWPSPVVPDKMPEFIFNVWVDKLVYAAVRCSREAHAEQLRAGGDLTTVIWMLIQHAGPFCMGETIKLYIYGDAPPEEVATVSITDDKPKPPMDPRPKKKIPRDVKPPMDPGPAPKKKARLKMAIDDEKSPKEKPSPPSPSPPPPYCCPVCPPSYHPSYPHCPVCHPYYDPSWPPVCPCYPQCPPQHEKSGDEEPEEAGEDEHEESSSDEGSEE